MIHTVTGHAGLARNTGGDEDDLGALESIAKTRLGRVVASDGAVGVDVAQVSGNTCRIFLLVSSKITEIGDVASRVTTYQGHRGCRRGQAQKHGG
jgi:hypothetical protein